MNKKQMDELQNKAYEPFYVTEGGLKKLKEKLVRLKGVIPDYIAEAQRTAAYGDRSENDEYKNAKATLRRTKWQILNIEDQIKRVEIIKFGTSSTVQIGSTVVLAMDGKKTFQIVGPHETDPAKGRISFKSPLGSALMGHKEMDNVTINLLGKNADNSRTYHILKIE